MGKKVMISVPMVGEISSNMMFGEIKHAGACIYVDGCVWTFMGAVGCGDTGGQENKVNGDKNGKSGCVLKCVTSKK